MRKRGLDYLIPAKPYPVSSPNSSKTLTFSQRRLLYFGTIAAGRGVAQSLMARNRANDSANSVAEPVSLTVEKLKDHDNCGG